MLPVGLMSFFGAALLAQLADWIVKPLDRLIRGALVKYIPALRE